MRWSTKHIPHEFIDGVEHKLCSACKEQLTLDAFNKHRGRWDGLSNQCRLCSKASKGRWEKNNPIKHKYTSYKHSATERGYDFNLTFEQFCIWWQKPCFYCGDEITTIGLDRIDNERGYEMDNVVPCCTQCNRAKLEDTMEDFVAMCVKVAARHGGA